MKKPKKTGSIPNHRKSDRPRRGPAGKDRIKKEPQHLVDAHNQAFEDSVEIIKLIEGELMGIRKRRLPKTEWPDFALLQTALLVGFAQEYTRSLLLSAPMQLRGISKEWVFDRAQKIRDEVWRKGNDAAVETGFEEGPDYEEMASEVDVPVSKGGIIMPRTST